MGETYCMSNEAGAKTGLEWKELYERTEVLTRGDVLRSLLLRQLHHGAISSYRIDKDPVLKISLHDEPFGSLVISPLEWFLFGEEPNNARKKLSDVNSPPTLCGKVFKTSEPTYSCR